MIPLAHVPCIESDRDNELVFSRQVFTNITASSVVTYMGERNSLAANIFRSDDRKFLEANNIPRAITFVMVTPDP